MARFADEVETIPPRQARMEEEEEDCDWLVVHSRKVLCEQLDGLVPLGSAWDGKWALERQMHRLADTEYRRPQWRPQPPPPPPPLCIHAPKPKRSPPMSSPSSVSALARNAAVP